MLDLLLLGPPQLAGSSGPLTGPGVQRRRIAILALLSSTPGHAVSRDKLIAVLWPECRTDTARHRLSVALHELRRALGEDAVFSRGDDVCLNTGVIRADVAVFEQHDQAGRWKDAAAIYRGPFLDGFYLDDAPEFERWADTAREQYARRNAHALEQLAIECRNAGDQSGELIARRRLAAHDPFSTTAALELIRVLNAAGDRSSALQHARIHAERLRAEFDVEPDEAFVSYVNVLRTSRIAPPPVAVPQPEARVETMPPSPRRRWPRLVTALGVPVLALAAWTAWSSLANSESAPVRRVAVMPFTVIGSEELKYLADGMVDLLSTNMNGAGDVRTIDPHALFEALTGETTTVARVRTVEQRLGANSYITGTIYVAGENVRVNATLNDIAADRPVATATVDGKQDDIFSIVDQITTQLIGNSSQRPGERPVRIAAATTRSVPALKAYLAGETAFRAGRFVTAADEFTRAATIDTMFAIANYRLALSMLWADMPDTLPFEPEARALRHSAGLPAHDQQLIRAFVAWRNGDAEEAERIYRTVVRLYPDDAEAWHQLGETLYHYNPVLGRAPAEADYAFERAALLDPDSWAALWHRALIAGSKRDIRAFDSMAAQLRTMKPEPAEELELDAVSAYLKRDRGAIERIDIRLERASPLQLFEIAWRIATLTHDAQAAAHVVQLAVAQRHPETQQQAYVAMASLAAARGDRAGVESALSELDRIDGGKGGSLLTRASFMVNPSLHYSDAEVAAMLARVDALVPIPAYRPGRLAIAATLAARLGRTDELRRYTASFEEMVRASDHPEAHAGTLAGLNARIALLEGRPAEALATLSSARNKVWFGWAIGSTYWSQVADRYLRAELLSRAGRVDEALKWYESIEQFSVNDFAYAGAARARQAEIRARTVATAQSDRR